MKKHTARIFFIFCLITITTTAQEPNSVQPAKKWYCPQLATTQFAGNIGLFSLGLGTQFFHGKLQTSLLYGYVPKSFGEVEIHTISIKNAFILDHRSGFDVDVSSYIGHTFSFETGNNSFVELPNKYPKGYYSSNAFHFTFFIGGKVHKDLNSTLIIHGIDLFTEIGSVDTYLWYWLNSKEVHLPEIVSMAVGLNLYF